MTATRYTTALHGWNPELPTMHAVPVWPVSPVSSVSSVSSVEARGSRRRRVTGRGRPGAELGHPMFRSGYLLVVNAGLSAAVGVAFWLAVARLYPPDVVGFNSAAISAMMFIAGVAQLNLMSALLRFVPTSGGAAGRMIGAAFAVGGLLSALVAAVFVAGLERWSPGLSGLLGSRGAGAGFVLASAGWALFVMLDSALVALGRAGVVVLENLAFSVVKLGLVVVLAAARPDSGVWLAWTSAMGLVVLATCGYLTVRVLPAFRRTALGRNGSMPSVTSVARYLVPDYVGSLAWIACTSLVPVLVFNLTGAEHSAVFALAWAVSLVLYGLPAAFGQSLVAHGVTELERLPERHRRVERHMLVLVGVPAVVAALAAPLVLASFGSWYANEGVPVLRFLVLSALPQVVTALEVSRARAERRMARVVGILLALAVGVLGLTVLLVPSTGLAGAGLAWLLAQSVVAAALLRERLPWTQLATVLRVRVSRPGTPTAGQVRELLGAQWSLVGVLAGGSDTRVALVRPVVGGVPAVLKVAVGDAGARSLERERVALVQVTAGWTPVAAPVPEVLDVPSLAGSAMPRALLLSRVPGRDGRTALRAGARPDRIVLAGRVLDAVAPLWGEAAPEGGLGPEHVAALVTEPVAVLAPLLRDPVLRYRLARVEAEVARTVRGRAASVGRSHGDLCPDNVLFVDGWVLGGVVDWAQSREPDLVALDAVHWLLTTAPGRGGFGAEVARRLSAPVPWSTAERRLLDRAGAGQIPDRTLLLLGWLRHVGDNLTKAPRYAAQPVWWRRTVVRVLQAAVS